MLKFVSWNVNGLRAVCSKGFVDIFNSLSADAVCLQETKIQAGQIELDLPGYYQFYNYAERKGYSGTAIFTRNEPLNVRYGIGKDGFDDEGRVIALEYPDYWLVTVYTPNSKDTLARLGYRCVWEDEFRLYLKELEKTHPVIVCGDLNCAHREIDLKNPGPNRGKAGFTDEEREKLGILLDDGFIDTFRYFYPDKTGAYSWWSYRANARANNAGWRIDYFLVSAALAPRLADASILPKIFGSDHCPVTLLLREKNDA